MEFLPAVERQQLITSIDRQRVASGLARARKHSDAASMAWFGVATIELHGGSIGDDEFLCYILDQIGDQDVDPAYLCFDIAAPAAIRTDQQTRAFLALLRQRGCRILLDQVDCFDSEHFGEPYLTHVPMPLVSGQRAPAVRAAAPATPPVPTLNGAPQRSRHAYPPHLECIDPR